MAEPNQNPPPSDESISGDDLKKIEDAVAKGVKRGLSEDRKERDKEAKEERERKEAEEKAERERNAAQPKSKSHPLRGLGIRSRKEQD
jgi:hypothetical protein